MRRANQPLNMLRYSLPRDRLAPFMVCCSALPLDGPLPQSHQCKPRPLTPVLSPVNAAPCRRSGSVTRGPSTHAAGDTTVVPQTDTGPVKVQGATL